MNRYFNQEDKMVEFVGDFKIPRVWWSRPYEYAFALEQVKSTDTVLDVGCGMEHPFKHELGRIAKKVVAIDTNPLVENIKDDNVEFVCADILDFKTDLKFDKIFLISTLEQTQDYMIEKFKNMQSMLADGGKIIITSDYPSLDPLKIIKYSKEAKLEPTSQFNEEIPQNGVYHSTYKLNVYSLILEGEKKMKNEKNDNNNEKIEDRKTKVEKPLRTKPSAPTRTKKG